MAFPIGIEPTAYRLGEKAYALMYFLKTLKMLKNLRNKFNFFYDFYVIFKNFLYFSKNFATFSPLFNFFSVLNFFVFLKIFKNTSRTISVRINYNTFFKLITNSYIYSVDIFVNSFFIFFYFFLNFTF